MEAGAGSARSRDTGWTTNATKTIPLVPLSAAPATFSIGSRRGPNPFPNPRVRMRRRCHPAGLGRLRRPPPPPPNVTQKIVTNVIKIGMCVVRILKNVVTMATNVIKIVPNVVKVLNLLSLATE